MARGEHWMIYTWNNLRNVTHCNREADLKLWNFYPYVTNLRGKVPLWISRAQSWVKLTCHDLEIKIEFTGVEKAVGI
jgi:hypothetical protein